MRDGNILCYDPVSGKITLICDVTAATMFVYKDGIYYIVESEDSINKTINRTMFYA